MNDHLIALLDPNRSYGDRAWGGKVSCGPFVLAAKTTEHLVPSDGGGGAGPRPRLPAARRIEAERAVRSCRIVVIDALVQHAREMSLVEHDQVVQALSTQRPDHSLCHRVRVRSADRSQDRVDADPRCPRDEV